MEHSTEPFASIPKYKLEPKHSSELSFIEEIQKACTEKKLAYAVDIIGNQEKQFNLGCTIKLTDPLETSDFLIEREYGDVFDCDIKETVFIPPVFISAEYARDIPTLGDNVEDTLDNLDVYLKKHFPQHWLTSQLDSFLKNAEKKDIQGWITKMKLLYLVNSYIVETQNQYCPSWEQVCNYGLKKFFQEIIKFLSNKKCSPSTLLLQEMLQEMQQEENKLKEMGGKKEAFDNFKQWIKGQVESKLLEIGNLRSKKCCLDITMRYIFGLNYSKCIGEEAEHFVFKQLQKSKDVLSDFVILHSLNTYTAPSTDFKKNKEYDFLLLSAKRKLIVAIEVKRSKDKVTHARKQLESTKEMFETKFADEIQGGWRFCPVVFVYENVDNNADPDIVTRQTISECTKGVSEIKEVNKCTSYNQNIIENTGENDARQQLKNLIKILVFCLHLNRPLSKEKQGPLTTSKWINWLFEVIETVSTYDNIWFYSKEQLEILFGDHSKVIIDGGYGTGKTILLREKAKMLARQGEKVLFLVHPSEPKSLLQLQLEDIFSEEEMLREHIIVSNYMVS